MNYKSIIKNLFGDAFPFRFLLLSNFLFCVTLGSAASVIGVKLGGLGVSVSIIGQIITWHNVGALAGAICSYRLLNKFKHVKTFILCVLLSAIFIMLHAFYVNNTFWGVLRFLFGFCEIIALVVLESWFNIRTDNKNRGTVFSFYMISAFLGLSAGPYILKLPDSSGFVMFTILSLFCLLAIFPISRETSPKLFKEESEKISLFEFFKRAPVGVFACFISGSISGLFYALGVMYILNIGLGDSEAALFASFTFLGGMLFQYFIGRLSDGIDRRKVLMLNSLSIMILALFAEKVLFLGDWLIIAFSLFLGGFVFTLYTVGVAFANDRAEKKTNVFNKWYITFYLVFGGSHISVDCI